MVTPHIPRVARGPAGGASAALLLALSSAVAQDVRPGRYEFTAVASGDRAFSGVIHLTRAEGAPNGALGGRILSTLANPIVVRAVEARGDTVVVSGGMSGGRTMTMRLVASGDSLAGTFSDGTTSGPLRARYATARGEDPNELRPTPCRVPGLTEVVRCATHWVWEDRARGAGRRIPLNVVVLPAGGTERQPDPLFLFAGGPGQSTTSQAAGNAQRFATLRRARDLVMVDQRGTGGSNELSCEFEGTRERAALLLGGGFPPDQLARCRDALQRRADLRLYHTAPAVEDVDDVRGWLGYERINLYGGSYGTRAALAYMRRFPDRVRTATLRAVESPEASLADNARDAQLALERLLDACAADAACAAAYPRAREQLRDVLARLDAAPVTLRVFDPARRDTVDVPLTRGGFAASLRRLLMDGESARRVPLAIDQAARGDWSSIQVGLSRTVSVADDIAWGMMLSVICAEDPPLVRRAEAARNAAGTFIGDTQLRMLASSCAAWPAGTPPAGYDRPVTARIPTLLLSGEFDPTTPPRMGETVARALPGSLHLVLPGVSHGPFPGCALDVMSAFVAAGATAGLDTACVRAMRRGTFALPAGR